MKIVYDDLEYARARLNQTVVFYGGQPATVNSVDDLDKVRIVVWPDTMKEVDVHINDIDVSPPMMGFINCKGVCSYLSRLPFRQWKQGFRTNQLDTSGLLSRLPQPFSIEFINLYKNIYPKYDECMEMLVCGEATSQAFNRYFGVFKTNSGNFGLAFKGKAVAKLSGKPSNNVQPDWAPGREFLREFFEETMEVNNA